MDTKLGAIVEYKCNTKVEAKNGTIMESKHGSIVKAILLVKCGILVDVIVHAKIDTNFTFKQKTRHYFYHNSSH